MFWEKIGVFGYIPVTLVFGPVPDLPGGSQPVPFRQPVQISSQPVDPSKHQRRAEPGRAGQSRAEPGRDFFGPLVGFRAEPGRAGQSRAEPGRAGQSRAEIFFERGIFFWFCQNIFKIFAMLLKTVQDHLKLCQIFQIMFDMH